jgi:hypothetical protein
MDLKNIYVRVTNGRTKNGTEINNTVFRLLSHLQQNEYGMFITVDGKDVNVAGIRNGKNRIYINKSTDYVMLDSNKIDTDSQDTNSVASEAEEISNEEIAQDLKDTFEIIAEMTRAVSTGVVKGLVISGPAGVSKSHTVEEALAATLGAQAKLTGQEPKYDIFKGYTSAINLYCLLYRYSNEGSVLVLDDADSALYDEDSLNLLKAVLDTKKVRRVHWGTNSVILEKEGIPTSFEFKGGIIFITNIKWDNAKSHRIANHLQALMSRVHYINININTLRERIIHINNVALGSDMLDEYSFTKAEKVEILDFLIANVNRLHTVDLRTVIKCSDLAKAMPTNWKSRAAKTLFKNKVSA